MSSRRGGRPGTATSAPGSGRRTVSLTEPRMLVGLPGGKRGRKRQRSHRVRLVMAGVRNLLRKRRSRSRQTPRLQSLAARAEVSDRRVVLTRPLQREGIIRPPFLRLPVDAAPSRRTTPVPGFSLKPRPACAPSTTFAGQRQLFLPAKGEQRRVLPSRPGGTQFMVVGRSRAVVEFCFLIPPQETRRRACGRLWESRELISKDLWARSARPSVRQRPRPLSRARLGHSTGRECRFEPSHTRARPREW